MSDEPRSRPDSATLTARRLTNLQERLRLVLENVRDYAIFMLDDDGTIASWSAGAELIKGYSASEVLGRHFSIFYPPEEIAAGKPDRELDLAREHGRVERCSATSRCRRGSSRTCSTFRGS